MIKVLYGIFTLSDSMMSSISDTALCDAEVRHSISCSVAFNLSNCSLMIHSMQLYRLGNSVITSSPLLTLFVWEGQEGVLEEAACMEALQVLEQI